MLSNEAHAAAWAEAFSEFGYTVPLARLRSMIGMGGDKVLAAVHSALDDESEPGKSIAARRRAIFLERYAPHLQAAPGARELVAQLQSDGLRCVVASSAQASELQTLLRIARVDDLVRDAATSDDAERSKPDPDIVAAALEKAGAAAPESIMLGDTPYDVEAARKAGVPTIALRCGGWDDAGLEGAAAIYDDPADLLAHLRDSPLRSAP